MRVVVRESRRWTSWQQANVHSSTSLTDLSDGAEAHEEVARAGHRGGHGRVLHFFKQHERRKPTHALWNEARVSQPLSRCGKHRFFRGRRGRQTTAHDGEHERRLNNGTEKKTNLTVRWHLTWSFPVSGYYRLATYWMQPGCTLGFFAVEREERGKYHSLHGRLCSSQKKKTVQTWPETLFGFPLITW